MYFNLHINLSKPDDARYEPSGENLHENTSPSCPDNSIIGASRFDVLWAPFKYKKMSN